MVSNYVEPTTSQLPANAVVKLGEYLMCQSRLCKPRRTTVSFTAWKLRKVSLILLFVHSVTYYWWLYSQQLWCPSTWSQQRLSHLPMWLFSLVITLWVNLGFANQEEQESPSQQENWERWVRSLCWYIQLLMSDYYICSNCGVHLRGAINVPVTCQCGCKAGWMPHGPI